MEMTKLKRSILLTIVFFTLGSLASVAWAGDVKGKVTAQGMRSPENIAVYIDSEPGKTFPPPAQHVAMDQLHLAFVPHVLIVLQGTTVDFKNGDAVGHNIYWPAINHNRKLAHNMGTWPQGIVKSFTFNDLGDVPLLCNVHPEMSAYIIVVPTPYFALTDKEGSFTIKNVPPGQYTLKTWSEEAKPETQAVTAGTGVVNVNLAVKK
jgi:plastocyanin